MFRHHCEPTVDRRQQVNKMIRLRLFGLAALASTLILGCSAGNNGEEPAVEESASVTAAEPSKQPDQMDVKAIPPFAIEYEVVGTPVVGSPVALELKILSAVGSAPVEIDYRTPDSSALMLSEAQPESLTAEFRDNEQFINKRVTVIPLREGRLYLNVSVALMTESGRVSSVTSLPLHVGAVDTSPEQHGEVEITEDGEAIKVLRE